MIERQERRDPLERVRDTLESAGLGDAVIEFETSTATAELAAEAIGCELGQIAKSLVFVVDGEPVLALVAGDMRGDAKAIARACGGSKASFADPATVLSATGYDVGGVSPFDLPEGLTVLIDESLERFRVVYPAGGTARAIVRIELAALLPLIGGRLAPISAPRDRR